jgi:hypothetical protein
MSIDKTTRTKLLVLILHLCVCVCVYPGPINDLFLLLKEMMTNAVVIHHCVLLATIAASWGVYTIDGIGRSIIREYLRRDWRDRAV